MKKDHDTYRFTEMDRLIVKLTKMGDDDYVATVINHYRIYDYNLLPVKLIDEIAGVLQTRYLLIISKQKRPNKHE